MANIGDRVIAIRSSDNESKTVTIYGVGTYQGEQVPEHVPFFKAAGVKNPMIKLDSGDEAWGFECWWGPEDAVRRKFDGYTFVEFDIKLDRKAAEAGGEK